MTSPAGSRPTLKYLVVMDSKENTKKCTVAPLSGRSDFHFEIFDRGKVVPKLDAAFLLHIDGVPLQDLPKVNNQEATLAVIDSHWKACEKIIRFITPPLPSLVKIPPDFVTAYPRSSKIFADPDGGLATIEAVFIAATFLGTWDETLLDHFHWKKEFLRLNAPVFARYGLGR
jgi:pre-rRNA-processing protein TSR3